MMGKRKLLWSYGQMPVDKISKSKVFTSKAFKFFASEAMQIFDGGGSKKIIRDLASLQIGFCKGLASTTILAP